MMGFEIFVNTVMHEALGLPDGGLAVQCRPIISDWLLKFRDCKWALVKYHWRQNLKKCKLFGSLLLRMMLFLLVFLIVLSLRYVRVHRSGQEGRER